MLRGAAQSFRKNFEKNFEDKVELWDVPRLEKEFEASNLKLALMVCNSLASRAIFDITMRLGKFIIKGTPNEKVADYDADIEVLWAMKDRIVTSHKCASMMHLMLDEDDMLVGLEYQGIEFMVRRNLEFIYIQGLSRLRNILDKMSPELQSIFKSVYDKTQVRSNWSMMLENYDSGLVPGEILKLIEKREANRRDHGKFLERMSKDTEKPNQLEDAFQYAANAFGSMSAWSYGVEGAVDYALDFMMGKRLGE